MFSKLAFLTAFSLLQLSAANKCPVPALPSGTPQAVISTSVAEGQQFLDVAYPSLVTDGAIYSTQILELANHEILLDVIPPRANLSLSSNDGISVLYGSIREKAGQRTPFSIPDFTSGSLAVHGSKIQAGEYGAIVLHLIPQTGSGDVYDEVSSIPLKVNSTIYSGFNATFTRFDQLPGGQGSFFIGKDFWNFNGTFIHVTNGKVSQELVHMQYWAVSKDTNCGVHNHEHDHFLEQHICLSPGSGNGGMMGLKPEVELLARQTYLGNETEMIAYFNTLPRSAFDLLEVGSLEEQGHMWKEDECSYPVRNIDDNAIYPYHKWQSGNQSSNMDIWFAVEWNPDLLYPFQGYVQA